MNLDIWVSAFNLNFPAFRSLSDWRGNIYGNIEKKDEIDGGVKQTREGKEGMLADDGSSARHGMAAAGA